MLYPTNRDKVFSSQITMECLQNLVIRRLKGNVIAGPLFNPKCTEFRNRLQMDKTDQL